LRGDWFDSTGSTWTNPSPNLRSVNEAVLYPGVAMIEGTNISVGRGTDTPFELLGAPWINPRGLAEVLTDRMIPGQRVVAITDTLVRRGYANPRCGGVNVIVNARNVFASPELGLESASALRTLCPNDWKIDKMIELLANRQAFNELVAGGGPRSIAESWR